MQWDIKIVIVTETNFKRMLWLSKKLIFEWNLLFLISLKKKEIIVVYVHFNCVTMSDSSPSGQDEYKW